MCGEGRWEETHLSGEGKPVSVGRGGEKGHPASVGREGMGTGDPCL